MNDLFKDFLPISEKEWKHKVQVELKGANYTEVLCKEAPEGFQVKPLYTQEDVDDSAILVAKNQWKIMSHFVPGNQVPYDSLDGVILNTKNADDFLPTQEELLVVNAKNEVPKLQTKNNNTYLNWDFLSDLAQYGNWANKDKEETISNAQKIMKQGYKKSLSLNTSNYQNAGANHAEQLALALAEANEYVALLGEEVIPCLMSQVAVGGNFFFEVAKLRALRILWGNFTQEYGKQEDLFVLAESTQRNKSVVDRYNNIIRTTFEGVASVLGNADGVVLQAYDELMQNQKATNHELSFKQQWILREESFLNNYIDPLKGAYFVEALTKQLAEKAWEIFKKIESKGGFIACLQSGFIQNMVNKSAQEEQEKYDKGDLPHIGTNKYPPQKDGNVLPPLKEKETNSQKVLFATISPSRWSEKMEADFDSE